MDPNNLVTSGVSPSPTDIAPVGRSVEMRLAELQQLLESAQLDQSAAHTNAPGALVQDDATVIFLDLEGYTELLLSVGARATIAILNEVFSEVREVFCRYEVFVNQYLGDGLMAFARGEDNARRAVAASCEANCQLEQHDATHRRPPHRGIRLRTGVSSGSVVFGFLGTPQMMSLTAVGLPTNLAARLQEVAIPGALCLSSDTFRQVKGECSRAIPRDVALRGFGEQRVYDLPFGVR